MNRITAWAAIAAYLAALLALWAVYPHAPAWAVIAGLSLATMALWVVEVSWPRHRARVALWARAGLPEGASVEEFLAAVDRLYGTAGANSGAASPQLTASWNGEPYPGHDHDPSSPPCPACLAALAQLAQLAGAQVEAGIFRDLGESSGAVLCGASLGAHQCGVSGSHATHRCGDCGTLWGRASDIRHSPNWTPRAFSILPMRGPTPGGRDD